MINFRSVTVVSGLSLLVVVLVAGCSVFFGPDDTITIEEAEQRVEDYSRQALAVLPAQARPEVELKETGGGCGDALFGTRGQENATLRYQICGLPSREYPEYFDRLEHWWRDHNFDDQIVDERPESILVYNDEGFRMHVLHEDGELLLITISPCVWPNGTPEG